MATKKVSKEIEKAKDSHKTEAEIQLKPSTKVKLIAYSNFYYIVIEQKHATELSIVTLFDEDLIKINKMIKETD